MPVRQELHHGKRTWLIDIRYTSEGGRRRRFRHRSSAATKAAALKEEQRYRDYLAEHGRPPGRCDPRDMTVEKLGQLWTRGELHRLHPDHIRKTNPKNVSGLLEHHIFPAIGMRLVSEVTLDDCERVLSSLKPVKKGTSHLQVNTRRNVARCLVRLLNLAVFPLRIRDSSPIPKGWVPKNGTKKAKPYLYPEDDAKVLSCAKVPLEYRILWGFLIREGCRASEAINATIGDFDLERGVFRLDQNKTDCPRSWVLDPSVRRALAIYLDRCRRNAQPEDRMFVTPGGRPMRVEHGARLLRRHVEQAAITEERKELLKAGPGRCRLTVHHLRGAFVTLALANGKTETWVQDRTGHTSSLMVNHYRRQARTHAELDLGPLGEMDRLIPELAQNEGATE